MTLCPNCGTWIAEDDLERGCFTCGFTVQDVRREKQEETSPSIPLLAKEREAGTGANNAQ